MSTFRAIASKLSGNVIDIQEASTKAGALLDAFPPKKTGADNQMWDFVLDPAGSGYYFIKSKLSGNVIDIQEAATKVGALLDAFPQKKTGADNQLWDFIPDPAGSGYHFIRSRLSGHVVDIQQASTKAGALLDAFPQKKTAADNQLWKVVDGEFPAPVFTSMSWANVGTGAPPNAGTLGSGGNKFAYQVSLSIGQDGTCTYSGYYQNRGDTFGTAPPQGFVVVFFVHDTAGKAYGFMVPGQVPSAPQNGSLVTWNLTMKCPVIAENWYAIAAKNSGSTWIYNTYDDSVWGELWNFLTGAFSDLGTLIEDAAKDLGTAVEDVIAAFTDTSGGPADGGDDGGDEEAQAKRPSIRIEHLPPLPSGLPTGAAATTHIAGARLAGTGK